MMYSLEMQVATFRLLIVSLHQAMGLTARVTICIMAKFLKRNS